MELYYHPLKATKAIWHDGFATLYLLRTLVGFWERTGGIDETIPYSFII